MRNLLLITFLLFAVVSAQFESGPRLGALGEGGVADCFDYSAPYKNPAALALLRSQWLGFSGWTIFSGVSENPIIGDISGAFRPASRFGFGFDINGLDDDYYSKGYMKFALGFLPFYSDKLSIGVGLASGINYVGIETSRLEFSGDTYIRNDAPLGFGGFDIGGIIKFGEFSTAISFQNLGASTPVVGNPSENFANAYPLSLNLGAGYYLKKLGITGDFVLRAEKYKVSPIDFRLGGEIVPFDILALRLGANLRMFTTGLGIKIPVSEKFSGHLAYAFNLPFGKTASASLFHHRFGLALEFGKAEEPVPLWAELSIQPDRIPMKQVEIVKEEQPIIPVVFFDAKSSIVNRRFDEMLKTIGLRLAGNPDVFVEIRGYYHPAGDDISDNLEGQKLAKARADAVRARITELVPDVAEQIIVQPAPSPDKTRAGEPASKKTEIQQENQRAEITAVAKDPVDISIPAQRMNELLDALNEKQMRQRMIYAMDRNQMCEVIIEGVNITDSAEVISALRQLDGLRTRIKAILPENSKDRVFIHPLWKKGANATVRLVLSAEPVVYKPREGESAVVSLNFDGPQEVTIIPSAGGKNPIERWDISIFRSDGELFVSSIRSGTGQPAQFQWDLKNRQQNFIDPREKYYGQLWVKDTTGKEKSVKSRQFGMVIRGTETRTELLNIVQFVFDEIESESHYLEGRLEFLAREIIRWSEEPDKTLKITVGGHTDITGSRIRNEQLSLMRAEKELNILRQYMMFLLGLGTSAELDQWLADKNVQLSAKGYADDMAYKVRVVRDGKTQEILLGDNATPEGRTTNRRVVIEFQIQRQWK